MITCFEEWCNQAIAIFSGHLGVQSQAAMAICFAVMIMMFFIPLSYGYAISATLGSAIGAGEVEKAKRILKITLSMTIISSTLVILFVALNKESIVSLYIKELDNKEVFDLSVSCLSSYCVIFIFDSIQVVLQSAIKGLGLQEKAQRIAVLSFFIIGLPCSYLAGI